MLKVSVPASSANLGPGFDFVGLALNLYNHFYFFEKGRENPPAEAIIITDDSLVHKGMDLLGERYGRDTRNIGVAIIASVPRTRGLGSSATLTLAGVIAANTLFSLKENVEDIINLATSIEGHPDNVAAALVGGLVVCIKTAEGIKYIKTMPKAPLKVIVAVPEFILSTDDARKVLPSEVSYSDAVNNAGRFGFFMASMLTGDYSRLSLAMEDLIHQPYRMQLVPGMREVMKAALDSGALGSCLSGAGPSILAFHDSDGTVISENMKATWQRSGIKADIYLLDVAEEGILCEEI